MRFAYLLAATVFAIPSVAQAATCEESFTRSGSILSGMRFSASVQVPDLTPASAIGQMRGVVAGKGYDILVAEPEDGSMLIEQPQTSRARAFPITITATRSGTVGTVSMEAKMRGGQSAKAEDVRTEMCAMLSQVRGGRAGQTAAATGMRAVSAAPPMTFDALTLSQQISKDTERNPAAIPLRYQGKTFIINGTLGAVDRRGGDYIVVYNIPHPHEQVIRLPNQANFKTDIGCVLARGQAAFALQLRPNARIRLTGEYDRFDANQHLLVLKNCRNTPR